MYLNARRTINREEKQDGNKMGQDEGYGEESSVKMVLGDQEKKVRNRETETSEGLY